MAKIYAKNMQYTGVSASVPFVNGVGETSDPHLIEWFRDHDYNVVEDEPQTTETTEETKDSEEEDKEEGKEEKKGGRNSKK